MAKTPIDILLDKIEFEAIPSTPTGGLPYATHSGVLKLGDKNLRVYLLNDGRRIIDAKDIEDFFGKDFINSAE